MSSSDGIYYPTLTVARPVVLEAEFVGSKWYKDDVEIPEMECHSNPRNGLCI